VRVCRHLDGNLSFLLHSPGSLEEKTIDLDEFMFGFQFLFKSKDVHFPQYLLASALWSKFLERAMEFEAIGLILNTDLYVEIESFKNNSFWFSKAILQFQESRSQKTQSTMCTIFRPHQQEIWIGLLLPFQLGFPRSTRRSNVLHRWRVE
jgi:hypothetical protein